MIRFDADGLGRDTWGQFGELCINSFTRSELWTMAEIAELIQIRIITIEVHWKILSTIIVGLTGKSELFQYSRGKIEDVMMKDLLVSMQ